MEEDFITPGMLNVSLRCEVSKTFHYLSSVYTAVFVIGLLGNVLGLWNLCVNWRSWISLNVFVFNLGVADLLYVVTLPFFVSYYLNEGRWMFCYGLCRLARLLFYINMYASLSFLTCISVQRYLGIVHPMRMMRPSLYISALVWVLVIVQILPNRLYTNAEKNGTYCHDSTVNEHVESYASYTIAITVTGFLIPFIVIMGCYSRILSVPTRNRNVDAKLKSRSIKMVFIILLLLTVCFFPYYTLRNLNLSSRLWQLQGRCSQPLRNLYTSYQVTRSLASMNSTINPLLYLITNENLLPNIRQMHRKAWLSFIYLGRKHATSDIHMLKMRDTKEDEETSQEL